MALGLHPISFRAACRYIEEHHRYLKPPQGWKFGVALHDGQKIVGVAVASRPVSRHLDDGFTIEITRMATDGTPNSISMLAGAIRRAAGALGYRKVITYAMDQENRGESLRAAGFVLDGRTKGGSWEREGRPSIDRHPIDPKTRWFSEAVF
jgi:hypothetical protein